MKKSKAALGEIYKKTGGKCAYCGKPLAPFDSWQMDHMDPAADGGSDDNANLVPACRLCNSKKKKRGVEEFRHWITHERLSGHVSRLVDDIEYWARYYLSDDELRPVLQLAHDLDRAINALRARFLIDELPKVYDLVGETAKHCGITEREAQQMLVGD